MTSAIAPKQPLHSSTTLKNIALSKPEDDITILPSEGEHFIIREVQSDVYGPEIFSLKTIRQFHEKVIHQGRKLTECAIRSAGYWVVGARRLINSIIHSCVVCRKLRWEFSSQVYCANLSSLLFWFSRTTELVLICISMSHFSIVYMHIWLLVSSIVLTSNLYVLLVDKSHT